MRFQALLGIGPREGGLGGGGRGGVSTETARTCSSGVAETHIECACLSEVTPADLPTHTGLQVRMCVSMRAYVRARVSLRRVPLRRCHRLVRFTVHVGSGA